MSDEAIDRLASREHEVTGSSGNVIDNVVIRLPKRFDENGMVNFSMSIGLDFQYSIETRKRDFDSSARDLVTGPHA